MARASDVECERLPCRIYLLTGFEHAIREGGSAAHTAAKQFDAALRERFERGGIEVRNGILITRLQSVEHLVGRDVAPSSLEEIEPIRLAFVLKAVGRGERRSHPLCCENFESRGHGPIK